MTWKCGLLMFSLYATHATFSPYVALLLLGAGVSTLQLGACITCSKLIGLVTSPIVGRIADMSATHVWVLQRLALCTIFPLVSMFLLPRWVQASSDGSSPSQTTATPGAPSTSTPSSSSVVPILGGGGTWLQLHSPSYAFLYGLMLCLYSGLSSPKNPMADQLILKTLSNTSASGGGGGGTGQTTASAGHLYGNYRLWGSVSWGLVSVVMGQLLMGDTSFSRVPLLHAGAMLCFALVLHQKFTDSATRQESLRSHPVDEHPSLPIEPRAAPPTPMADVVSWKEPLRALSRDIKLCYFLVLVMLLSVVENSIGIFLFPHLRSLGGASSTSNRVDSRLFGYCLAIDVASEVVVFHFAPWLLHRFSPFTLLGISGITFAFKAFAYAGLQDAKHVLLVEFSHGLGFACLWSSAVFYVNARLTIREKTEAEEMNSSSSQAGAGGDVEGSSSSQHNSGMVILWWCYNGVAPLVASSVAPLVVHGMFGTGKEEAIPPLFLGCAVLSLIVVALSAFGRVL